MRIRIENYPTAEEDEKEENEPRHGVGHGEACPMAPMQQKRLMATWCVRKHISQKLKYLRIQRAL